MNRRDFLNSIMPASVVAIGAGAVSAAPMGRRPLVIITLSADFVDVVASTPEDLARVKAKWQEQYPEFDVVVLPPGAYADVVCDGACMVDATLGDLRYRVVGRDADEVERLHNFLYPVPHFHLDTATATNTNSVVQG